MDRRSSWKWSFLLILKIPTLNLAKKILCLVFSAVLSSACSQNQPLDKPKTKQPEFGKKIDGLLSFTVPLLSVSNLIKNKDNYIIFDAREKEEFEISHIPDAIFLGYSDFNEIRLKDIPKESSIVVYCSIGYRSEKIGEKMLRSGYKNVYNLYGSIFEWVNENYPLVNAKGKFTSNLHSYNKSWSKWVTNKDIKTVW
ncbi:MAG: rhodanese-like domain-containing protein [Bacteroidetes bacterium]|nr:rhodanese-like domain-containing protein [Bacteroidota bacterium]